MNEIKKHLGFPEYQEMEGVNSSSFQLIDPERDGCPSIWYANRNKKTEDTPAMFFGRACHKFILEFDNFFCDYSLLDDHQKTNLFNSALATGSKAKGFSKSLSTYKKWKDELKEQGKEIIDTETMDILGKMRKAVDRCLEPRESCLLGKDKETELSIFAELPDHRGNMIQCKGRIDALLPGKKIIDLKTTISASPTHLSRHIPKMKLYVQAAFYMDLLRACGEPCDEFYWCFIDKRTPYPCSYLRCEDAMIRLGRSEYRQWLGWIYDGYKTNNWPGHTSLIDWPNWFIDQLEAL
tara:strand:- start:2940 stop:3821 length:882 start_codon:yes stop_codon:yes gene_type:complete